MIRAFESVFLEGRMARVRKAKLSIDDYPMLPFVWEEAGFVERVTVAALTTKAKPKPKPKPKPKLELKSTPAPLPPRQPIPRPMPSTPFGTWLLAQTKNDGWIGDLAKAAKADRAFPRNGDADAVRERLSLAGAEVDMVEAVDVAELAWLAC
jgi:hypothetical protein